MGPNPQNTTTDKKDAQRFLAAHPEVFVGRDALREESAKVGGDDANTFTTYNKPVSNIVLVQFDADTKERVFAVALVDDEQAEEYSRKYGDKDEPSDQSSGDAMQPRQFLFERAPAA
ncbi:transport sec22 [Trichoderma arundinaceum]|uniref:Transport sec22 n=1 Tax=Trichoderma arundinaceum TaxID=490622 RepID=A0A395NUV9_TRIAR|nr:transport sec22 [Trichoderma arundinaceum]